MTVGYRGRRILLVDDEPINREITMLMLEDVGLTVETAEDGIDAVEKAARQRFDAILMDMQMPRMDGLEATGRIRAQPGGKTVPIIAVTANAFAEDRVRCLAAGMNEALAKPVDPEALYRTLVVWLSPHRTP